jgi:light-regulated signal transduction histidine kinase (bacteriophytochrome)
MWRVAVEDNGIGMDRKFHDRVFEIFQRLHERNAYEGTGVGLAIVKRIVERHVGRVWFESTPGESTHFFFTVPAAPEP